MAKGIYNFSEIGRLNKVLLHRPGRELEALTPATMGRLLFEDIPYLKVAQQEHDIMAGILRDNGVEVVYYVDECARALEDAEVRRLFIDEFLTLSDLTSKAMKANIAGFLRGLTPRELVEKLIAGIREEDVRKEQVSSLLDLVHNDYPYISDPMLNLYFTRDPGACVGTGINIHHMHTKERRREALLLKYIYKYAEGFAVDGNSQWYDIDGEYSIEGGDVMVLSGEVVVIGLSQRTTIAGVESFAEKLLGNSDFRKVLVVDIPQTRAFMHLDTVFTMIDYDKFTIHPEIEDIIRVYEITAGAGGQLKFRALNESLDRIMAGELGLPAVEFIKCGGDDLMASQREQWNDGSNTLCIAPGKVITYERNYVSNDLLDRKGIEVLTMPSSELSRGRGGPRCMSCPVNRDDI